MDRAGLITLEQARAAGLSFDEPEPRACPHCGAALDPLGAALAGRVAWVSAAPCPCEGAAREREAEARRRAALAAKEEAARREKALSRAGIPRRYWAAEADRPEFAEYIASFAGNGGAGLYIHGGVGAGKTHAASAMARLFAEAGYDVAFTTAKGMLERVKATFDEGGTRPPSRGTPSATSSCSTISARRTRRNGPSAPCSACSTRATRTCARPSSRRTTRRARWRTGSQGAASA